MPFRRVGTVNWHAKAEKDKSVVRGKPPQNKGVKQQGKQKDNSVKSQPESVKKKDTPQPDVFAGKRRIGLLLIGGASAAGKSSLATALIGRVTPLFPVSQDGFLRKNAKDWDVADAVEWDALVATVKGLVKTVAGWSLFPETYQYRTPWGLQELIPRESKRQPVPGVVTIVLEGHLLYLCHALASVAQLHFWVDVTLEDAIDCSKEETRQQQKEGSGRGVVSLQLLAKAFGVAAASVGSEQIHDLVQAVAQQHAVQSANFPLAVKWKWPSGDPLGAEKATLQKPTVVSDTSGGESGEGSESEGNGSEIDDEPIFEGEDCLSTKGGSECH
eukprot:2255464-Amphidinium_carterae.1